MPQLFSARNAKDLLNMMLRLTPSERISAEEALAHPYLSRWRSQQLLYPIDLEAVAECERLLAIERTPEQWRGSCFLIHIWYLYYSVVERRNGPIRGRQ